MSVRAPSPPGTPVGVRRLTALFGTGGLAEHRARYGALPALSGPEVIEATERAGLRGRGGAGFPAGRKLAAVAAGRRTVVVANGCEAEPASAKDRTLLTQAPHLVLDGIVLAARAVGARRVILALHRGSPRLPLLGRALAERPPDGLDWTAAELPRRYVASEESALVHFLNTGDARPVVTPPRPYQRGVDGRPTLVSNVETLAQVALLAGAGVDWFRQVGTRTDPGSTLLTVGGAVARPGVYEVALGAPAAAVLELAGGVRSGLSGALVGGYFGGFVAPGQLAGLALSHDPAWPGGPAVGAGVLVALPAEACGLAETSRILGYLAHESAGQCGPCQFGLPAIAEQLRSLVAGRLDAAGYERLLGRLEVIGGRGACRHPDGAVRLAGSALAAFAEDVRQHLRGYPCRGTGHPAVLPVPHPSQLDGGWR